MKWSISCLALWRLVQGWTIYDLLSQTTPVKPMLLQKADQCNSQDGCHAQPPPQMRSWRHSQSSEPCAQGQCQGHLAKGGMGQFTTRPWKGRWIQGDWGNFHVNFNIYFKHVAVSNKVNAHCSKCFFSQGITQITALHASHACSKAVVYRPHVLTSWCFQLHFKMPQEGTRGLCLGPPFQQTSKVSRITFPP